MKKIVFGVLVFAAFVIGCWIVWALNAVQIAHWALGTIYVPAQAGPWGDSFGAFNALFGALGFTAVVGTFLLQGRSLKLQQEDLHRQRFEASFFELLSLARDLRRHIRYAYTAEYKAAFRGKSIPKTEDDGQRFLRAAVEEVGYWMLEDDSDTAPVPIERIAEIYVSCVDKRYSSRFAPYFRMIYTILRRISEDKILSPTEKVAYGNILRSQLGTYDVALLALNALSPVSGNLAKYLEEFRMLKYLRQSSFQKIIARHFPATVFEARD